MHLLTYWQVQNKGPGQVHKYLNSVTIFIIVALYTITVDLKIKQSRLLIVDCQL